MMPTWPVRDGRRIVHTHGGRAFGAMRADGKRHHAGMDLSASAGDVVVAPESGEVVAVQPFNGPRAWAMLIDTGQAVILLGEIEPDSWTRLHVHVGDTVHKGQPVALVGVNPGGSSMLHFELYRSGTRRNYPWYVGQEMPEQLIDPTAYLFAAAQGDLATEEHDDHQDPTQPTSRFQAWAKMFGVGVLAWLVMKSIQGGRRP